MAIITRWVANADAGMADGSSQANAFDLDGAIDYINGTWPKLDHLDIRVFEDVTLVADPSVITVSGISTAQVIWSGWVGSAATGGFDNRDVNADNAADFIWRWNTTDTLFEYMYWRLLTAHDCSGSIAVPWEFSAKPVRHVVWSDCHAYGNRHGWSFKSDDDPNQYWKWERCSAYSNSNMGWNLPTAPE